MDYAIQVITLSVNDVDKAAASYAQQRQFRRLRGPGRQHLDPPGDRLPLATGLSLTGPNGLLKQLTKDRDRPGPGTASTEAAAGSQLTECRERLMAVMPTVAIRP